METPRLRTWPVAGEILPRTPHRQGVILESHGLFTWGDTPKECYETTISVINQAIEWFERRSEGLAIFSGEVVKSLDATERRAIAAKLMPKIRA